MVVLAAVDDSDEEAPPDVRPLKCPWKETSQRISLSDGGVHAVVQRL